METSEVIQDWKVETNDHTDALAKDLSDNLKYLVNKPILGLYYVHRHIRDKGGPEMSHFKKRHLQQLTILRSELAGAKTKPKIKQSIVAIDDLIVKIQGWTKKLKKLHIESQPDIGTSRQSNSHSVSSTTSDNSPSKLPLGFGQTLDNNLLEGDIDVDEYALRLAKMADSLEIANEYGYPK